MQLTYSILRCPHRCLGKHVVPAKELTSRAVNDLCADVVQACNVALGSLALVQGEMGMGHHAWDLRASDAVRLSHASQHWQKVDDLLTERS